MTKYLIIPAMPTPNGPLHLGHVGGPFLRADILARYLRQQGNQVTVLSGTDNFENYAYRQALKENLSPLAICNKYYSLIAADLKTMNIHLDDFINPHDEKWHERYHHWCFRLLQDAEKARKIRHNNGHIELKMPSEFALQNKGIHPSLINAYQRFLSKSDHCNTLTSDCDWGIPVTSEKTLLSYGFVYAYYQMLAEHAGTTNDTTIISTFGVDNTVPILASVLGFTAINPTYKPVDYYLINYFYYFNGKKFSTSAQHAIWVRDFLGTHISIDILRLFLAGIDVSARSGNFSFEKFLQFHDRMKRQIAMLLRHPVRRSIKPHDNSKSFFNKINTALQPAHFRPHHAVQAIHEWFKLGETISAYSLEYDAWLKALGEGIYPFMPDLFTQISALTGEDKVCINMM